jgi:hypothetical protein
MTLPSSTGTREPSIIPTFIPSDQAPTGAMLQGLENVQPSLVSEAHLASTVAVGLWQDTRIPPMKDADRERTWTIIRRPAKTKAPVTGRDPGEARAFCPPGRRRAVRAERRVGRWPNATWALRAWPKPGCDLLRAKWQPCQRSPSSEPGPHNGGITAQSPTKKPTTSYRFDAFDAANP